MTGTAAPPSPPVEPKRIRQFREGLVKALPKFPNDRATRDALLDMSLAQLLIHYCNWRLRFIRPAPRTVTVASAVTSDPRYVQLQPAIDALLTKARNGEDLSPHLSLQVDSKGFTLAATGPNPPPPGPQVDRWADKDFLLNVMGFHHLHLGTTLEAAGHVTRTNEVLFVRVTRDTFEAVMILDHSVFEVEPDGGMTPERTRLWTTFDQRSSRGVPAGTPYIATMVSLSGHPMQVTMYCGDLAHFIIDTEAKLKYYEYVKSLYNILGLEIPNKSKFTMHMNGLDFGLIEASTNTFWNMNKGWI